MKGIGENYYFYNKSSTVVPIILIFELDPDTDTARLFRKFHPYPTLLSKVIAETADQTY